MYLGMTNMKMNCKNKKHQYGEGVRFLNTVYFYVQKILEHSKVIQQMFDAHSILANRVSLVRRKQCLSYRSSEFC